MAQDSPSPDRDRPEGADDEGFRVDDRRHWVRGDEAEGEASAPPRPAVLDEYRVRAEGAERKLLEYIEAFKRHQREQDEFRQRASRDIERRVELKFGELVADLLESLDNLDLALAHAPEGREAEGLVTGVRLARNRFAEALARHGVEAIDPAGSPFDPHVAEAVRVDPVATPDAHDHVTETLRQGYRLGERVLRAARVAVGRHTPASAD